ncbi:MAG: NADH-quinone oxidoreductase subunit J [Spirochaetes bacterium]|nr:NADH-quinone oxidoreductase subunit J [Spirochaetota bacterium]
MIQSIIFYIFAALSVLLAVLVILQKNVMHSVLYLSFTILAISGVFFTLHAEFLGAVQILVYAGGIIVLYLFVIIIVNLKEIKAEKRNIFPKFFIVCISVLFLAEMIYIFFKNRISVPANADFPEFEALFEMLLSKYLIPFEIASILLLAVLIGSIIIARRKLLHDSD